MGKVFLVRHCKATGQEPEAQLTEVGVSQASLLAEVLAPQGINRIISSDYRRAIQSAEPLARNSEITIEKEIRLRECNMGNPPTDDWKSALRSMIDEPSLKFEQGESSQDATERATEVINHALNSPQTVALFTHGLLLTLIAKQFDSSVSYEFWETLKNPDIFQFVLEDSGIKFSSFAL